MRARLLSVVIALGAALLPMSASASDGAMSVAIPTALPLTAKVLVTVPLAVVCTDIPDLTPVFDNVFVSIEQAHSSTLSHGSISLFGGFGAPPLFLTCDGSVHVMQLQIFADANGSPFRGGQAVVTAFASRTLGTSCGPGCFTNTQSISDTTGPVAVRLRG